MKKTLLALAALATLPCVPALAAGADSTPLEPVVVVGTRSEQGGNRLPAAVTVITREQIERSGALQLVDVLRTAGAVQVTDFFGDGSFAIADLRGFGENAHSTTLILVDGRRLNNTDIASPDLAAISLKDIERIEIIEGSAGALYGDQAVGGVINIVTREPGRFRATAEGGVGSYRSLRARGAVEQRWTSANLRLSAEARGSDNYRKHNALEYKNLLGRLGFEGRDGGMFVEIGYVDEDLETPGALNQSEVDADRRQASANFKGDFSDNNTGFVRVNFHETLGQSWGLETDLDHRRGNGAFRLSSVYGPAPANAFQDREIRAAHPRLQGSLPMFGRTALITLGADGQLADYKLASMFGVQTHKQHQGDVYGQAILPLAQPLELTAGARYASVTNEVEDGYTFVTPTKFGDHRVAQELGLAFRPWNALRLYARYDRNFRFAKVDEFTAAGAPPGSNSVNLRTQTGLSTEAGAEWTPSQLRLSLGGYRLSLHDEIAFDPNTFTNINLDRTRRDGLLAQGEWHAGDALWLSAAAHHVVAKIDDVRFAGRGVPLVARNTAKVGASARLPRGLLARLETQYTGKRVLAGDFDNSQRTLPGHAVVNAGLGWALAGWHADLRISNLLDRRYAEYGVAAGFPEEPAYYPSPERNFQVSARYDW